MILAQNLRLNLARSSAFLRLLTHNYYDIAVPYHQRITIVFFSQYNEKEVTRKMFRKSYLHRFSVFVHEFGLSTIF